MRTLLLIILPVMMLSVSGCKLMYVPNAHNVPQFKEEGDVKAHLGFRNFQLAYAFEEKMALIVNGYYRDRTFSNTDTLSNIETKFNTKNTLIEAGTGFYETFGEDTSGTLSLYGGIGSGKTTHNEKELIIGNSPFEFRQYSANINRYFIQGAIGKAIDRLNIAFSLRLNALNFNSVDTVDYTVDELRADQLLNLEKQTFYFVEPAFTMRGGNDWVKGHGQVIYSNNLTDKELNYRSFLLNFGIVFNITEMIHMIRQ